MFSSLLCLFFLGFSGFRSSRFRVFRFFWGPRFSTGLSVYRLQACRTLSPKPTGFRFHGCGTFKNPKDPKPTGFRLNGCVTL